MKILALECSAGPVSCAISENGKIVSSRFAITGLTHSQTLMPMVAEMLKSESLTMNDIDGIAISYGPGSFTGIRIGISAAKGLATPRNLPCYPVSTLRAIAEKFRDTNCTLCAVMDARCNQVYNALFRIKNGNIERLCPDRALMIEELINEIKDIDDSIIIAGDGFNLFKEYEGENIKLADEVRHYQDADGVALSSSEVSPIFPDMLRPFYLRLPQAERELKLKKEKMK